MTEKNSFRTWHQHGVGQEHDPPQIYLNAVDPKTGRCEFCDDDGPECDCIQRGQPMTDLGVMHTSDCPWLAWFRSSGGCMGDV